MIQTKACFIGATYQDYSFIVARISLSILIGVFLLFFLFNYLTEHPFIMILDLLILGFMFMATLLMGNYFWRIIGLGEDAPKYVFIGFLSMVSISYLILGRVIRKSRYLTREAVIYLIPILGLALYFQLSLILIIGIFVLILIILCIPVAGEIFSILFFMVMLFNGKSEFIKAFDQEIWHIGFITTFFIALSVHLFMMYHWNHHSPLLMVSYLFPLGMLITWFWEQYSGVFLVFSLIFITELILYIIQPDLASLLYKKIQFEPVEKNLQELRLYKFFKFIFDNARRSILSVYHVFKKIPLHRLGKFQYLIPLCIGIGMHVLFTEALYPTIPPLQSIRFINVIWAYRYYPEGLLLTCFAVFGTMALLPGLLCAFWFIWRARIRLKKEDF